VYLANAEFMQKTLLKHLYDNVNVNFCREVHLEILEHKDKGLPKFIQKGHLKIRSHKFSIDNYETRMLGKILPSRKKGGNKGEIDNFIVAVDQIHFLKKYPPVFITDDEKALNGSLLEWLNSFPAIRVWTSYEVVLYLYAQQLIPSKDIALDVIKELVAFKGRAATDKTPELTSKLTKILAKYNKRLEYIAQLLN
jgi:hypothetical protein